MRLLLLARARTTGRLRLLTEHAFDSKSAAVEAAAITAAGMDLSDDEVLAVDLDSADPVLVLRIGAAGVESGRAQTSTEQSTVERNVQAAEELRAAVAAFAPPPPPPARPHPRFPLFGAADADVTAEEDLSTTLRSVARRMAADLGGSIPEPSERFDEDWDARALDDYTLPSDGRSRSAREEGHARMGAADSAEVHGAEGMHDAGADARVEPQNGSWDDAIRSEVGDTSRESSGDGGDGAYAWWEPRDHAAAEDAPADFDDVDDRPGEASAESVSDADRVEAPVVDWEPSSVFYRPAATDFAVWVCADCVYQRTCPKAGAATPATCGSFQWKAR